MTTLTVPPLLRINARLDEDRASKVEMIRRATGLSRSEVVKQGIDLLFEDVSKPRKTSFEALTETGLIGMCSDPDASSSDYKEELRQILEAKYGQR